MITKYIILPLLFLLFFSMVHPLKAQVPVDVALVLLVDISNSIDDEEYKLQKLGITQALLDEKVKQAILNGPLQRISITVIEFDDKQRLIVPWTLIEKKENLEDFAYAYYSAKRSNASGLTSIAESLIYSADYFDQCNCEPIRKVIDISGDGIDNVNSFLIKFSKQYTTETKGITVNGLVISGAMGLEEYYHDNVIGGPGHFMVILDDFKKYFEAMKKKLILEIS